MTAQPLLYELMGIPQYLLDTHVDLLADDRASTWQPAYAVETGGEELDIAVTRYCHNDEHLTGAAVALHPLLDIDALKAIYGLLREDKPTELFELNPHAPEAKVHIILSGRLRLVAHTKGKKSVEIGQCRSGQWIGMPSALREFDEQTENTHWSRPSKTTIEAIPFGEVITQSILVKDLVAAMGKHPALARYVRHHVSIRFARREQILGRLRENSICRLLTPADQEYLLQLGTIRRVSHRYGLENPSILYLSANKPSRRVSLMLAGKCTTFLPNVDNGAERYVGKFGVADLIGHEAIVMPEERYLADHSNGQVMPTDFEIREAPRVTDVYASPGTEVLEFFWFAFRWTLDDRMYTWRRIVSKMLTTRHGGLLPEIVAIQASRGKLGTSALAQGLAVALTDMVKSKVCIVDLQGEQRFEHYFRAHGFTFEEFTHQIQETIRAKRAADRGQVDVHFRRLKAPTTNTQDFYWPTSIELVWPTNPNDVRGAEDLVELILNRADVRYVILCMRQDAASADDTSRQLAMHLNSRCSTVLYVTDEAEVGYKFSDVEPPRLVWVERMTEHYMAEEHKRLVRAMNEAKYGDLLNLLPRLARHELTAQLGGTPEPNDNSDFLHRRQIVRVPEDPQGAKLSDEHGPHAVVGRGAPDLPLKRALERLARVVTRRTVGLALGGGGAWGFCHVALLQNIEEHGVPIDYITGTSFGSIIGGLYVAGGSKALERLIEENSLDPRNPLSPILAAFVTPLMRSILLGSISAVTIEWFINNHLRRMNVNEGRTIGLGTTEIPFYPISSNLTTHRERTEEHSTVGHGVRLSGTAPPMAPAFRLNGDLIVDGAFIANVPSRYLREIGADFVIAANAVPPAPAHAPKSGTLSQIIGFAMRRFNDTLRANQLLTWKAGEDQAHLHADYRCDLRPKDSNVIDMWKGRAIMEQIRRDHFSGEKATAIRDAWKAFCEDPCSRRDHVDEPDAGDGSVHATRLGHRT